MAVDDRAASPAVVNTVAATSAAAATTPSLRSIRSSSFGLWIPIFPPRRTPCKDRHSPRSCPDSTSQPSGRHEHHLLDADARVGIGARLHRDDHAGLEHGHRARDERGAPRDTRCRSRGPCGGGTRAVLSPWCPDRRRRCRGRSRLRARRAPPGHVHGPHVRRRWARRRRRWRTSRPSSRRPEERGRRARGRRPR